MRGRVVAVDSAPEHRDGVAAGLERAAMSLGVDSAREAADDDEPGRRQLSAEAARDLAAVGGAGSRTDDCDRRPRQQLDLGLASQEEPRRRVVDRVRRSGGKAGSERARKRNPSALSRASSAGASNARLKAANRALRGSPTRCASVAAANAASASSLTPRQLLRRAVRERLGDVLGRDRRRRPRARRPSARRGRRAPGRGPRAAAARPPGSSSSSASAVRRERRRRRAARARPRPAPHRLPRPRRARRPAPRARGRGTATTRSKRSSSARESLSRKAASRCGEHEHSAAGSPRAPHGHRFIVPTSWKRAGKSAWPATRATATTPSSSGWRSASSAGRGNSASSSRSRTPRCARLASPGRGPGAAADDRGRRGAVVRRAERPQRDERALRRQHAGDRVDPRHLERLRRLERRQDRRAAGARASSCRFPAARRAAGCARPPPRARARGGPAPDRARRRGRARAGVRRPRRAARAGGGRARRGGTRPPRRGAGPGSPRPRRARPRPPTRRAQRIRSSPARRAPSAAASAPPHGPDPAVERELADRGVLREPLGRNLPRRRQHRERDREVEAGALLAQGCRREVDRDPPRAATRARPSDPAADPLLRLLAGAVGEADDREPRHRRAGGAPPPRRGAGRGRPARG